MNRTSLKVWALILIAAMIVPFAVSCGEEATPKTVTRQEAANNNGSGDGTSDGEASSATVEKILPDVPDVTYDGYEFRILSFDNSSEWSVRDMYSEGMTGDLINDAVYTRNAAIEDKLKIKITEIPAANAADLAKKSISAGLDEYDMIVVPTESTASLALNGCLYRLDELDYIDPEKPWWDTVSYDSFSVANAHYMIIGDIQIMDKDATWIQFFNKKMIQDYGLENPVDLVLSGDWTIEKEIEMAKQVTDDTNGDGAFTKDDTYGFISHSFCPIGFFYGFGENITSKNADDIPELTINSNKISQVINYIDELAGKNSKIGFIASAAEIQVIFQEDRALFMSEVLQLAERLREMETDFGIIPHPKFDKDQSNYYTLVHKTTCVISVPLTITDEERTGIIIESLCAESKYTLRKAYYDTSLTTKFLRYDDDSSKMLDLIFENRVYDLGCVNDWGGYYSGFQNMFTSGNLDFASMYEKNRSKAIKAIDKVVEKYQDLA